MASELVIQLQHRTGQFSCEKFDNLPAPKSAYVAICFPDNAGSEALATKLKTNLVSRISSLGANFNQSTPPCHGNSMPFMECQSLQIADNTKLLIVASDGQSTKFSESRVFDWPGTVLPVMQSGKNVALPSPFNLPQVGFWDSEVDEVIPTIFGLLGISDVDSRIFISYKRTDTSAIAEQLFDELTHKGFEVFLDKFSIRPAVNFQSRLYQELADKAMVLFLESPRYLESTWVQLEIDFAKLNRLGYMALNIDGAPEIPSIDSQSRVRVSAGDLMPDGTIRRSMLDILLRDIQSSHTTALFLKRHYLNQNITAALTYGGKIPASSGRSGFVSHLISAYGVWTTPRPPKVNDYQYVDRACPSIRRIIFGPQFMEEARRDLNTWLAQRVNVEFYDEGQIIDLINSL